MLASLLLRTISNMPWVVGCTDEIQVVDAGLGALVKRKTEEVQQEWIQDDKNWEEWTGPNLSASRKRVLTTLWFGEGYERACMSYNFTATFNRTGANLSADGSGDEAIKLQGLAEFSFTVDDARRDPFTGEFTETDRAIEDARLEAQVTAADSDNSDHEECTDREGSESDECDSEDDTEGPPYEPGPHLNIIVVDDCPSPNEMEGILIAHRFDDGWSQCLGTVRRKVTCSINVEENGKYAVKYPDDRKEYFHDLFVEDYGIAKMWVAVKQQ